MNKDRMFRNFVFYVSRLLKIEMFLTTEKGICVNAKESKFLNDVYVNFLQVAKEYDLKTIWHKRF